MENLLYFTIAIIYIGGHILNVLVELVNINYSKKAILDIAIADVYNAEEYQKQQSYEREKLRTSLAESTLITLLVAVAFIGGYFGQLNNIIVEHVDGMVLQSLIFFGLLWFVGQVFSVPFDYYNSFVTEAKYGFNKSTKVLFFTDLIKSLAITVILGGAILLLITWLYTCYTSLFWLPALVLLLILSLFSTLLYTSVILPLFNKKTPLPEGALKESLAKFALSTGFSAKNIYVLDSSKRSTKGNAFFTGWGKNKRIYLYDTLIDKLLPKEIEAVLAHEIGHYKKLHIWVNFTIGLVVTGLFLFLFTKAGSLDLFTPVLGAVSNGIPNFHLNLLGFAMIFGPVQSIIVLFTNHISRKMEFSADAFAKDHSLAEPLASSLKKMAAQNYSNLTPHPLYVKLHYSHPPLYQRIKALMDKQ